jgi:hypothetical protein
MRTVTLLLFAKIFISRCSLRIFLAYVYHTAPYCCTAHNHTPHLHQRCAARYFSLRTGWSLVPARAARTFLRTRIRAAARTLLPAAPLHQQRTAMHCFACAPWFGCGFFAAPLPLHNLLRLFLCASLLATRMRVALLLAACWRS